MLVRSALALKTPSSPMLIWPPKVLVESPTAMAEPSTLALAVPSTLEAIALKSALTLPLILATPATWTAGLLKVVRMPLRVPTAPATKVPAVALLLPAAVELAVALPLAATAPTTSPSPPITTVGVAGALLAVRSRPAAVLSCCTAVEPSRAALLPTVVATALVLIRARPCTEPLPPVLIEPESALIAMPNTAAVIASALAEAATLVERACWFRSTVPRIEPVAPTAIDSPPRW